VRRKRRNPTTKKPISAPCTLLFKRKVPREKKKRKSVTRNNAIMGREKNRREISYVGGRKNT
jgi:hypothetical protein